MKSFKIEEVPEIFAAINEEWVEIGYEPFSLVGNCRLQEILDGLAEQKKEGLIRDFRTEQGTGIIYLADKLV